MRASKAISNEQSAVSQMQRKTHISGAEGIYKDTDIRRVCNEYIKRALTHPRGKPDEIVITIEKMKQKPKTISLLPVTALKCGSTEEAAAIIEQRLMELGVSRKAILSGFGVLESKKVMRGASLILMRSGRRVEPDKERGVRVSRMGIEKVAEKRLSLLLSKAGINTAALKEALILASKASCHPDVVAEVCMSDDPDYTTGYVASEKIGYMRIPNVKKAGDMRGGRVFFIRESADCDLLYDYLERTPVIAEV